MHKRSFYCSESSTAFDLKYSGWVSLRRVRECTVNRIEVTVRTYVQLINQELGSPGIRRCIGGSSLTFWINVVSSFLETSSTTKQKPQRHIAVTWKIAQLIVNALKMWPSSNTRWFKY